MTQKRNAVGYITSTSYLRSDGGTDLFDIEYNNANFPQNPTKVTAYGVVTDITYNSFGAMETKDVNSSVLGVIYSEQWNYGTDSLLQSYTNRRGHSMYYSYDSRKNLVQMTDFEERTQSMNTSLMDFEVRCVRPHRENILLSMMIMEI